MLQKINSSHDDDTRNKINRSFDVISEIGRRMQDLVAEGQLTPIQYATLLQAVNSLISKGNVSVRDIDVNLGKFGLEHLSDEVKESMTGTTPILSDVADNSVTTSKVVDNAITHQKTSFIKSSSNLVDKRKLIFGKNIDLNTGEEINSSVAYLHPPIQINPENPYYSMGFTRYAFLNSQGNFISANSGNGRLNPPSNARFIKCSTTNPDVAQLSVSETQLSYEEYFDPYFDNVAIKNLIGRIVTGENIAKKEIDIEHLNIIEEGNNLVDKARLLTGYTISGSTGELVENSLQNASDFIKIEPETAYTGNFSRHAEYDAEYNFVFSVPYSGASRGNTFITRTNTQYLRVVYANAEKDVATLNLGDELLPYEKFKREIKEDLIPKTFLNPQKDDYKKYFFDNPFFEFYTDNNEYPNYLNLGTTPASEIYDLFDGFMSDYPNYISKTEMGKPSNDPDAQSISYYKFTPPTAERTTEDKRMKVFFVCGTHGHEHITPAIAYHTLRNICDLWDSNTSLENLKYNIEYIVIPVLNTSGWDVHERVNANGVDLNRNFPTDGWSAGDSSTTTWGGNAPASENETQYIMQIIEENPDIDALIDFHNYHGSDSTTTFLWLVTGRETEQDLSQSLIQTMTRKWRKEYDFIPSDENYFVGTTSGQAGGLMATYGEEQDIPISMTYEQCWRWRMDPASQNYDDTAIVTGVEAFTNWLIILGRYFSK